MIEAFWDNKSLKSPKEFIIHPILERSLEREHITK
jgi:hypothetical protein